MDDMSQGKTLNNIWNSSLLTGSNALFLEQMYEQYLKNPNQVEPAWRTYFDMMKGQAEDVPHSPIQALFKERAGKRKHGSREGEGRRDYSSSQEARQTKVRLLIDAYRFQGHLHADFNPLKLHEAANVPELGLKYYDLSEADLDALIELDTLPENRPMSLRDIISLMKDTYCRAIGSEFMHISEVNERRWIQNRLESTRSQPAFPVIVRQRLLDRLMVAEGLERYLHARYVGQKRFSLEGAESLIPMLDELIQRAGVHGVREAVIGMAHRGRLNVLINILGKTANNLFEEFEGKVKLRGDMTGDVKYHMGFSSNIETQGETVHVALSFNPSHLEIVSPVVEGSVRARQDRRGDKEGDKVIPIILHGDAAFAGQGVVMETFSMSQSRGYSTKGTVHIVINNQIGFTTSNMHDARSSLYCTDIAKMVNAPVFHVDGNDPEAVLFVSQLALDYRMTFHKDVVIDLVCYRRHGHSEADEPVVTQPQMYQKIAALPTVKTLYANKLIASGLLHEDALDALSQKYRERLEAGESVAPNIITDDAVSGYNYDAAWLPYLKGKGNAPVKTAISMKKIRDLGARLDTLPEEFVLHSKVEKIIENRRKMTVGAMAVDWGYAETMAYASLLDDDFSIRLSGQDAGRGTFFHRHVVLHNQKKDQAYIPLRHLNSGGPEQKQDFLVINSLLSEEAVLAFEYGYSTTMPRTMVIWEAQFGDFANNAQVVIDQFITAGEQKWNRNSGLVMMLPHGYEGQGPEHSSARLERYLQLCAQHNIQVCNPTSPAQMFHLLRRQMLMKQRKPLIIMTPKSLLRHRAAISAVEDLTQGEFKKVIADSYVSDDEKVTRILLCSGKLYYDLDERRVDNERHDVAIIRIEQLYPFPRDELKEQLDKYPNATDFIWCQEEPKNQGAWFTSQHHMRQVIGKDKGYLEYVGRDFSAAPAVGYMAVHVQQLHALLDDAFNTITSV